MEISQKAIEEFKELYKRKYNKELTNQEAYESASNLLNLFKWLLKGQARIDGWNERLKTEPEGFLLDGAYTCAICRGASDTPKWYHWYGIACSLCRKAISDGIVPAFAAKHRESWYAMWELEKDFGIKHPTARKLVREGKLVAHIVLGDNGRPYEYVFLRKENPEFVDPDRDSPVRKSWKRNRDKTARDVAREELDKMKKNIKTH